MTIRLSFKGYNLKKWIEKNKIEILKVFGTIEVLLTAFVMTGIFNMAAFIIIKFGVGAIIIKFLFDAVHYFFGKIEK